MKYKVGIIIDNPRRDLLPIVEVANILAKRKFKVDLVPMYFCKAYLLGERPNLLVFNYARKTNANLIKMAQLLNVKTAILDTEGAVFTDISYFINTINSSKVSNLDLYMTWGYAQKKTLEENFQKLSKSIIVTGHPRFDRYINYELNSSEKEYVLINTNFTALFPKYSTLEKDFASLQEISNLSKEDLAKSFRSIAISYGRFLESIVVLVNSFSNVNFLIRAHPFENDDRYKIFFSSHPNVIVNSEGDVFHALTKAFCIIHFDCTTAIEASLLGIPAFSLEFCEAEQLRQVLPKIVSKKVFSTAELIDLLHEKLAFRDLKICVSKKFDENLYNYFGPLDGKSSDRVAEAIYQVTRTIESDQYRNNELVITFKDSLIKLLYKISGISVIYFLASFRYFNKIDFRHKFFSLKDVSNDTSDGVTVIALKSFLVNLLSTPSILRFQTRERIDSQ